MVTNRPGTQIFSENAYLKDGWNILDGVVATCPADRCWKSMEDDLTWRYLENTTFRQSPPFDDIIDIY